MPSGAPYIYSVDSMKEFAAETSNYSVEFGQAAGGQVNAITQERDQCDPRRPVLLPPLPLTERARSVHQVHSVAQHVGSCGRGVFADPVGPTSSNSLADLWAARLSRTGCSTSSPMMASAKWVRRCTTTPTRFSLTPSGTDQQHQHNYPDAVPGDNYGDAVYPAGPVSVEHVDRHDDALLQGELVLPASRLPHQQQERRLRRLQLRGFRLGLRLLRLADLHEQLTLDQWPHQLP